MYMCMYRMYLYVNVKLRVPVYLYLYTAVKLITVTVLYRSFVRFESGKNFGIHHPPAEILSLNSSLRLFLRKVAQKMRGWQRIFWAYFHGNR